MPEYPSAEDDRVVSASRLQDLVETIFARCGMRPAQTALLADTLVVADLRGCHSHGVLRVPEYVAKLTVHGVDPLAEPAIVREEGAALVIDGHNAMGQIGCEFAMRQAIERAQRLGVSVATVRHSNHCGAMGYFAMQALPHDMLGLATTNALPTMAPWGGRDKIIGINPLAVAIPAQNEQPVVLDAAFSGSSHGKIRVYHQKGLAIPPDWAFDRAGRPTTDAGEAIDGLLQPIGGYKGTGLAIVMGMLSALLSGASYGTELGNMIDGPKAGADGQFLMAIKVSAFAEPVEFKQRVDALVQQICNSTPAPKGGRIYAPGGLEAETEQHHRAHGIPLSADTVTALLNCATEMEIDAGRLTGS